MKLVVILLLAPVLVAGNRPPLAWTGGVVESSFRVAQVYSEPAVRSKLGTPVRESIYLNTGEWLYHVSQVVPIKGMANLRDGDKIAVAIKGKTLLLRAGKKQYTTHIEQKSRNGAAVSSPASPR